MVIALGITLSGEKRFLGFVETDTENERVLTPFLRSLVERGLDVSRGTLVILDGGKGRCCMNTRCGWGGVARTSRDPPQEPHYGDEVEGSSQV